MRHVSIDSIKGAYFVCPQTRDIQMITSKAEAENSNQNKPGRVIHSVRKNVPTNKTCADDAACASLNLPCDLLGRPRFIILLGSFVAFF